MPAPTLTSAPMVASPRYARWLAFEPGPSTVFFSSTKLPTRARSRTSASGRRCANGPTRASSAMVAPVITQWLFTATRSPMVESAMRTNAWISQALPTRVRPSSTTPGWITVSVPTTTSSSM